MATARSLSRIFLVAVLVASTCFAHVAFGNTPGIVVTAALLQPEPGTGVPVGMTTLMNRGTVVDVMCRSQSSAVYGDSWWLKVIVTSMQKSGWVASYFVACVGSVGDCNVSLC